MAGETFNCFSIIGSLGYCFFPRKARFVCAIDVIMHPACVGLQYFERPSNALTVVRARFRSPCIIINRPRRFSLSTGSYLRFVGSQYRKAALTNMRHVSTKNGELYRVRCYDLNNAYSFNVLPRVARPYGWHKSPLFVSRLRLTLGSASSLEKFDSAAQ